MDQQGAKRVEVCGANDKQLITAIFCGLLVGDFLPIQVIYQGKATQCHPHYEFPPETTMIQYIENIIVPYIDSAWQAFQDDTSALIIMDQSFGGKQYSRLLAPPNRSDCLQPMDIYRWGFVKDGIAGGHADEQEGEQNAREDETDSKEYESDVMDLTCED